MAFFQNPFFEDFSGVLPTGDRSSSARPYKVRGNSSRSFDQIASWKRPTSANIYNLSGNDSNGAANGNLVIRFAYRDFTKFMTLTISVAGAAPATTTPTEIIDNLNNDSLFSTYFTASLKDFDGYPGSTRGGPGPILGTTSPMVLPAQIVITSKKPGQVKFYVENTSAEEVLGFNQRAGIADIPTYFARHTVDNLPNFTDSTGDLVLLTHFITVITLASPAVVTSAAHGLANNDLIYVAATNSNAVIDSFAGVGLTVLNAAANTFTLSTPPAVNVAVTAGTRGVWARVIDANLITNAVDVHGVSLGYTLAGTRYDYALLYGSSPVFIFKKQTVNAQSQVLTSIQYPAGSKVGDLGVLYTYTYTGVQTQPDTQTQVPYVLTAADLIVP